jgi:hypothetical protein
MLDRALLGDRAGARDRRLAGEEEDRPCGPGTLPTHTPLFVGLLVGTIVLVGALTFIPALALGPVVEHLQLHARGHAVRPGDPHECEYGVRGQSPCRGA